MEATSNWSTENNVRIHEVIQESTKFPTGDLVELLDEEKCISLIRPTLRENEECCIRLGSRPPDPVCVWPRQQELKARNKKLVSGIMILSEARIVEVFAGSHDEYCKTVHGKLMGNFDDSRIFKCEVHFENPKEMVMLKLKATCHEESLWVYGFHVTTSGEPALQTGGLFSSDHLSSVLKDKDVMLSGQALKFCQMLKDFNNSNDSDNPFVGKSPMALMSMMFSPMKSTPKSSTDLDDKLDGCGKKLYIGTDCGNGHGVHIPDELREKITESDLKNVQDLSSSGLYSSANTQNITKHILENGVKNLVLNCEHKNYREDEVKYGQTDKESEGNLKNLAVFSNNFVNSNAPTCDGISSASNPLPAVKTVPVSVTDQRLASYSSDCSNPSAISETRKVYNSENNEGSPVQCLEMHQVNRKASTAECSEDLLKHFENLIDKKFSEMEERLTQKIEKKVMEKTKENSDKLERIEGLLSKLFDRL